MGWGRVRKGLGGLVGIAPQACLIAILKRQKVQLDLDQRTLLKFLMWGVTCRSVSYLRPSVAI